MLKFVAFIQFAIKNGRIFYRFDHARVIMYNVENFIELFLNKKTIIQFKY